MAPGPLYPRQIKIERINRTLNAPSMHASAAGAVPCGLRIEAESIDQKVADARSEAIRLPRTYLKITERAGSVINVE
jgi:hypothetical protein